MNKINYPTETSTGSLWKEEKKERNTNFVLVEKDPHFEVQKLEVTQPKKPWWKLNMVRGLV